MIATALTLLLAGQASAENVYISNVDELIEFSDNVNSGTGYYGTTVYLLNDIDISTYTGTSTLYPVGKSSSYRFRGTFDGLGYTISNLVQSCSLQYVGLFGYTTGSTIKNVVLDSSCSFKSTYSGAVYIGSVLGYCYASSDTCTLDNIVNMADVSYDEYTSSYISYLGGIAGYLKRNSRAVTVKNCANYGAVTRSNEYYYNYIGGIAGYICYSSNGDMTVSNCLNSGAVSVTGSYYSSSSSELYVGGIAGYSEAKEISNCVSEGKITITSSEPSTSYVGSIIGDFYDTSSSKVEHCIWTANTSVSDGFAKSFSSLVVTDSSYIDEFNKTTAGEMNDYVQSSEGLNKWALLTGSSVSFYIGTNSPITLSSKPIILPTLSENAVVTFYDWYLDQNYKTHFDSNTITSSSLYGKVSKPIFVTLHDPDGHISDSRIVVVNGGSYDDLPTPSTPGYDFDGWYTESGSMVTSETTVTETADHTLNARWTAIEYIASFDPNNGGDIINKTYNYNDFINYPKNLVKEGYQLEYWDPSGYTYMPPINITFTAVWGPIKYYITFDFQCDEDWCIEEVPYKFNDTVVYPTPTPICGREFLEWDINITTMPAENVTVTAKWTIFNYAARFYDNNGTTIGVKTYQCGDVIEYPHVTKTYYTFAGWNFTDEKMPGQDLTIEALWDAVPTDRVKVTIRGNLNEDGVLVVVREYTDEKIVIKDIKGTDKSTTATIYFEDSLLAQMFVETVETEMAVGIDSEVGPKITTEYVYYKGYDNKVHRPTGDASAYVCYNFFIVALLSLIFAL